MAGVKGKSGGPRVIPPTAPNAPATQPVRVPTGQQYGQATQQAAAQQSVPLPATPSPPVAGPTSTPTPGAGGEPSAPSVPFSQGLDILAPTSRPAEPLTAGADVGPGPDFTALNMSAAPPSTGAQLLSSLALSPTASPEIRQLWAALQGASPPTPPQSQTPLQSQGPT